MWRLEVNAGTIYRLIRKTVLQRGWLELRVEKDSAAGLWRITKSGWSPLNNLEADDPATLLRAVALVLQGDERKLLESGTDKSPD